MTFRYVPRYGHVAEEPYDEYGRVHVRVTKAARVPYIVNKALRYYHWCLTLEEPIPVSVSLTGGVSQRSQVFVLDRDIEAFMLTGLVDLNITNKETHIYEEEISRVLGAMVEGVQE